MAKKKSDNKAQAQAPLTVDKYIRKCARKLPVYRCIEAIHWANNHVRIVMVARREPNGNLTYASYLVDNWCRGVYESFYGAHVSEEDFNRLISSWEDTEVKDVDYAYAHNFVLGAVEFAEEAGIKPAKEFAVSQYVLDEDTDDIPLMEFEYGLDGKYALECSNDRDFRYNASILKKNLAPDEYILFGFTSDDEDDAITVNNFISTIVDEEEVEKDPMLRQFVDNIHITDKEMIDLSPVQILVMQTLLVGIHEVFTEERELPQDLLYHEFRARMHDHIMDGKDFTPEEEADIEELFGDSFYELTERLNDMIRDIDHPADDVEYASLMMLFIAYIAAFTVASTVTPEDEDDMEKTMESKCEIFMELTLKVMDIIGDKLNLVADAEE